MFSSSSDATRSLSPAGDPPSRRYLSVSYTALAAERCRERRVLDGEGGDTGRLELLHRAHDVERVPVAVVGVDHEGQVAAAGDASDLLGELGQGQDDEIGRAEHRPRGDRPREHADLEP